ncbi:MAG: gluconeogenesis factor YvcK family protein [Patescibacteria group bacterium]|nr:gluconeogenesis factor YvcK family protein [Patescibacteria group bacterium]
MEKKIVTIGGGTGSFTILSGLKKFENLDLCAIVSMVDDGGSTGRLRDELGVLPPGDVRQCLVALSEESKVIRDLFNYRFEDGQLKGHAVGNIIISALEKKSGSFSEGLGVAMKVLRIKGRVIPVTDDNVNLKMKLGDGRMLKGESEINHNFFVQEKGLNKISLQPKAGINRVARRAIEQADVIVIGPGNHYCSIVPNLLVNGLAKALKQSKAKVVYVVNLVNKKGHTNNFTVCDYVDSINDFIGEHRIDYVIFNKRKPGKELISKYRRKGEDLVSACSNLERNDFEMISDDFLGNEVEYSKVDKISNMRSLIRHDGNKLANVIKSISESE